MISNIIINHLYFSKDSRSNLLLPSYESVNKNQIIEYIMEYLI